MLSFEDPMVFFSFNTDFANVYFTGVYLSDAVLINYLFPFLYIKEISAGIYKKKEFFT